MAARNQKSHPKRVAQTLKQPFVRLTHSAIIAARENGMPLFWAVFLMLFTFIDKEDTQGNIYAHCSRATIAEALHLSTRQVSNAISYLKRLGAIDTESKGHNGRATVYKINIGTYLDSVPTDLFANFATYLDSVPTNKGTYSDSVPNEKEIADINKSSSSFSTYNAVGTYSDSVPKELLKNSSFSDCSNNDVEGGQFPYGIDLNELPPKRFIDPLSNEELHLRITSRHGA